MINFFYSFSGDIDKYGFFLFCILFPLIFQIIVLIRRDILSGSSPQSLFYLNGNCLEFNNEVSSRLPAVV